MNINHMNPVYDVLSKVMNLVVEHVFVPAGMDVGNIGLLIQRDKREYGHCMAYENWQVKDRRIKEISLSEMALMKGTDEILGTMVHELIHAHQSHVGIKGTNGSYHNKAFRDGCDKVGLKWVKKDNSGVITPDQEIIQKNAILSELNEEEIEIMNNINILLSTGKRVIKPNENDAQTVEEQLKTKKKDKNNPSKVCPICGAKARAARSVEVLCGQCTRNSGTLVKMEQPTAEDDTNDGN